MAYQRRGYWYRSRREGGRVVTEYLGTSETASLIAILDSGRQAEREATRRDAQRERESYQRVNVLIAEHRRMVASLTAAALAEAGYHLHKRQWRKKRNGKRASPR